jgi:hypothetical protein
MMHTTESVAKAILEDLDNRGLLNGIDDVVLAEIGDEIEGNVANLGDVTTMECPTCAERGYDNTDYHRLHRAWCDSVAEIERLRAALEELAQTDGSRSNVADAEVLAARVRAKACQALTVPAAASPASS